MGKPAPTIYDPMCSVYVLESGEAMLRAHQAQAAEDGRPTPVMYLSTTDFVQHKYEPEEPEALAFYSGVDAAIGALDGMGAVIGVTADHGMNDKTTVGGHGGDSPPDLIFVESVLADAGIDHDHPPDHRPLRGASRSAGVVRNGALSGLDARRRRTGGDAGFRGRSEGADEGGSLR